MAKMMTFAMVDEDRARALGAISVRHAQLDRILKMTIKSITGMKLEAALQSLVRERSATLRKMISDQAEKRFGKGETLSALEAILDRCRTVTEQRNELMHSVVGIELDGHPEVRMLTEKNHWIDIPSPAKLQALADEIYNLAAQLNESRFHGFLKEALDRQK